MQAKREREREEEVEQKPCKTPWKDVPMEDKVSMVGGGRAGYEARVKHHYGDRGY